MSTQEYLSVLVSIVVGLGMSHLLAGVGRMVVARRLVRFWWGSLGAAVFVFLAQVQWWWSTIHSGEHLATNFFGFVFFLLVPIALYLMAVLVLPDFDDLVEPVSLRDHYFANHRWFYGLAAAISLLNAARNILVEQAPLWNEDRPFELTGAVILLGAAVLRSPRYHAVVIVCMLVGFVIMVVSTSLQPG